MALWPNLVMQLRRLFAAPAARRPARFRPAVGALEDRTVPAADLFADAPDITAAFAMDTTTNDGATGEDGEPTGATSGEVHSVWWAWTAERDGFVEVNTLGSEIDTLLAVYLGDSLDSLTLVDFNDDADGTAQSRVVFQAVAGTTYRFAVDGAGDTTGGITLRVGGTPANDNFATAAVHLGGPDFGHNMRATGEAGEPTAGASGAVHSVWWRWTAGATGTAVVDTFGSGFDTLLSVYTGSTLDSLNLVAANDDANGTAHSRVSFEAVAGTTYYIAVDGSGDEYGPVVLNAPAGVAVSNNPPVVSDQSFAADENAAAGTVVGTVAASDPDAGQTLTYSIVGGNASGAFAIDPVTGEITVADPAALDSETNPWFDLAVQVTDSGSPALSDAATVRVTLADLNEAPVFAPGGSFPVRENSAAGTRVGSVSATDPDAGQTLTYSVVGGNGSGAFAIDPETGEITVADPAALNHEATSSYTLTVRVTDNGPGALSDETTVVVSVTDVNEAPVLDTSGSMSLAGVTQGASNPGTRVADLLASAGGDRVTDPDAGAVEGVAVVAASTANGSWQYSTDGGATWSAMGAVSTFSARLLAADARVRFVPAAGYSGTVAQALSFRAWDQTSGVNGGTANVSANGGETAFSAAVGTAGVTVAPAQTPIGQLLGRVQSLLGSASVPRGVATALTTHLANAQRRLDAGNRVGAVNSLVSFIVTVPAAVRPGGLTPPQGVELIGRAVSAIFSILF